MKAKQMMLCVAMLSLPNFPRMQATDFSGKPFMFERIDLEAFNQFAAGPSDLVSKIMTETYAQKAMSVVRTYLIAAVVACRKFLT